MNSKSCARDTNEKLSKDRKSDLTIIKYEHLRYTQRIYEAYVPFYIMCYFRDITSERDYCVTDVKM